MGCLQVWLEQNKKGRRVWKSIDQFVYSFAAMDGERRVDVELKWGTCLVYLS